MDQLRADFTHCAEPAEALTSGCIPAFENEGENCGYQDNLDGLCSYCRKSSTNSTDSCCVTSESESRCQNVKLPTYSSMQPLFPPTSTATPDSATMASASQQPSAEGLSGGQIAGVVIGAVVGASLLLGLIICCCLMVRRRRRQEEESSLNQPTPPISRGKTKKGEKFEPAPGARVTRMAALEGSNESSPNNNQLGESPEYQTSTDGSRGISKSAAAAAGMASVPRREKSQSDGLEESSPDSQGYSSGDAAATAQSEQMDSFKDYYSPDEIHPGDAVSTLWAYSPRANDEFELERGDMLRIVGIWDDGWATGLRIQERIDQWEARNRQRDSGVSGNGANETPPTYGDVKAFPVSATYDHRRRCCSYY